MGTMGNTVRCKAAHSPPLMPKLRISGAILPLLLSTPSCHGQGKLYLTSYWNSMSKIPCCLSHNMIKQQWKQVKLHLCWSIIVQQDATIYSFIIFLQQLYMFWMIPSSIIRSTIKTVITTSGIGRTVFATIC